IALWLLATAWEPAPLAVNDVFYKGGYSHVGRHSGHTRQLVVEFADDGQVRSGFDQITNQRVIACHNVGRRRALQTTVRHAVARDARDEAAAPVGTSSLARAQRYHKRDVIGA